MESFRSNCFEIAPGWELVVVPATPESKKPTTLDGDEVRSISADANDQTDNHHPTTTPNTADANFVLVNVAVNKDHQDGAETTQYLSLVNFTGKVFVRRFSSPTASVDAIEGTAGALATVMYDSPHSSTPNIKLEMTTVEDTASSIRETSTLSQLQTAKVEVESNLSKLASDSNKQLTKSERPTGLDAPSSQGTNSFPLLGKAKEGLHAPILRGTAKEELECPFTVLGNALQNGEKDSLERSELNEAAVGEVLQTSKTSNNLVTNGKLKISNEVQKYLAQTGNLGDFAQRVIHISTAKQAIPEALRAKRLQQRTESKGKGPSTELHELCMKHTLTSDEVLESLQNNPAQAKVRDTNGRFPLHVIADNEALLQTSRGRETAGVVVKKLLELYPMASVEADDYGKFPFFDILGEWVEWAGMTSVESSGSSSELVHYPSKPSVGPPSFARMESGQIHMRKARFPRVEVWEEAEWCLTMLGLVLGALKDAREDSKREQYRNGTNSGDTDVGSLNTYLATSLVSKIPDLLQTILLIDDDGHKTRGKILQLPIVQMVLLIPKTVGPWIVDMLHHGGVPASRAIDYLWLVSETNIDDYTGGLQAPTTKEVKEYEEIKDTIMNMIDSLEGCMASISSLETHEVERAASSPVIWNVMNKTLARPFVFGLVILDIVLHFVFMIGFRYALFYSLVANIDETADLPAWAIYVVAAHYLIRKGCEVLVFANFSGSVLVNRVTDLWFVFDVVTIIAVVAATAHIENGGGNDISGFYGAVIGFLWIKVLAFLKVVNQELSTFITSVIIILGEIKYFTMVFVVFIIMFGDIFFISLSTKGGGAYCAENGEDGTPTGDFCTSGTASYIRVYSILLGDFELAELNNTSAMETLFILVSFFGIIVLLNVLIAVVSDSFEESKVRSVQIFSRSRAYFVAENQALEALLSPTSRKRIGGRLWLTRVIRWSVLLAIVGTAITIEIFLFDESAKLSKSEISGVDEVFTAIFLFVLLILMAGSLWIIISFLLDEFARFFGHSIWVFVSLDGLNERWTSKLAALLFGIDRADEAQLYQDASAKEEEWQKRAAELEHMVSRIVLEAKHETFRKFAELEEKVNCSLEQVNQSTETRGRSPEHLSSEKSG